MIFDIRGTHGSGKSTCVHTLLAEAKELGLDIKHHMEDHVTPSGRTTPKLRAYKFERYGKPFVVLGPYKSQCGGCDALPSADTVTRLVRELHDPEGVLILEGIIVSHTFSRYHELATEIGKDYNFLFLNTPLDVCIERVLRRREESGKSNDGFDPKNIIKDHGNIWTRVREKMTAEGHNVFVLDHTRSTEQFLEMIGWKI